MAERSFCTFYVLGERYGIDILTVREINRHVVVTPARGGPEYVRGLMNLRGQIVTVIDPALRLGDVPHEFTRATRLVILKTDSELRDMGYAELRTADDVVGLCVDRISDVVAARPDRLDPPPPNQDVKGAPLVHALLQLDNEVIRILDPAAAIHFEEVE
jgi:purine-binding chemotaxis protein CheW